MYDRKLPYDGGFLFLLCYFLESNAKALSTDELSKVHCALRGIYCKNLFNEK